MMTEIVGVFAGPLLLFLFIALVLWDRHRHRNAPRAGEPVANGPAAEPYRIFIRDFDLTLPAEDVVGRLREASPDRARGWTDRTGGHWQRAQSLAENFCAKAAPVGPLAPGGDMTVTFLVDQSGSMKGSPMAAVVAALEVTTRALCEAGGLVEILGFSTAGWQGGYAYRRWLDRGMPARPGRLCALLHIVYKTADQHVWPEASRLAMLHPDILRENVDGEALRWAAERSRATPATKKILIVLSDGAPVDDVTLLHNGAGYLERDLLRTISEIEGSSDIRLGAVGVGYDVSRYYAYSVMSTQEELSGDMLALIAMLAE